MAEPAVTAPRMTDEERGGSLLTASTLLTPATVVVLLGLLLPILILFRYSFNKFEPRVMMVEAVTLANENYIQSLFSFNVAMISLARALGGAETRLPELLGGK